MTKILIDEAAVRQALEALTDRGQRHSNDYKELKNEAITALRQALEHPTPAQPPPNCGTGYCSCIECLKSQP